MTRHIECFYCGKVFEDPEEIIVMGECSDGVFYLCDPCFFVEFPDAGIEDVV